MGKRGHVSTISYFQQKLLTSLRISINLSLETLSIPLISNDISNSQFSDYTLKFGFCAQHALCHVDPNKAMESKDVFYRHTLVKDALM